MKQIFLVRFVHGLFVALIAIAFVAKHAPANAGVPIIVACPSIHPFRENVPLERGELVAFTDEKAKPRQIYKTPDFIPRRRFGVGGPPGVYSADGWAYLLVDAVTTIEDDLECVYADTSVVNFPLPHHEIRGMGSCHFVEKWNLKDRRWFLITGWPYGVERKPMAVCVFNPNAVINPNFKPRFWEDDD